MIYSLKPLALAFAVLLSAGCAQQDTSKTIDITDIVLTKTSGDCADYAAAYSAEVQDLQNETEFTSSFTISNDDSSCSIQSNDIPNYDFNDATAHFADDVATQNFSLTIPRKPKRAAVATELNQLQYNAVLLNGVVLDELTDGCYKPEDPGADSQGNIARGCGPIADWRLNALGTVRFGTDSHNAHTQPGGLYHYHGNPLALFDLDDSTKASPVIGFAADGFPIFGPHFVDPKTGKVTHAISGYTLKSGNRPTSISSPTGKYDGTYIQDYEFTGAGNLDKCNGMTVNGQYGYYVTDEYPYVIACYSGNPDYSFLKR